MKRRGNSAGACAGWDGGVMTNRTVTAHQVARMKQLRASGWSARIIGMALNVPASTVRNWWNAGTCVDCGTPTDRSSGIAAERCSSCSHLWAQTDEAREAVTFWTRERIIAAIQWWNETYGEPPACQDWNPNNAILRLNDLARCRRGEQLISERRVPWFTIVVGRFGSWNAGIEAAGFTPRARVGSVENNARRRRAKEAA